MRSARSPSCEFGFFAARARSTEIAASARLHTLHSGGQTGHSKAAQQGLSGQLTDRGTKSEFAAVARTTAAGGSRRRPPRRSGGKGTFTAIANPFTTRRQRGPTYIFHRWVIFSAFKLWLWEQHSSTEKIILVAQKNSQTPHPRLLRTRMGLEIAPLQQIP